MCKPFTLNAFNEVEKTKSCYPIVYKIDPHSTYLILDLKVEQEFAGSVTWYIEAKHTLLLPLNF